MFWNLNSGNGQNNPRFAADDVKQRGFAGGLPETQKRSRLPNSIRLLSLPVLFPPNAAITPHWALKETANLSEAARSQIRPGRPRRYVVGRAQRSGRLHELSARGLC